MELLGQDLTDYVHPCDHQQLEKLLVKKQTGAEDEPVQVGDSIIVAGRSIDPESAILWSLLTQSRGRVVLM